MHRFKICLRHLARRTLNAYKRMHPASLATSRNPFTITIGLPGPHTNGRRYKYANLQYLQIPYCDQSCIFDETQKGSCRFQLVPANWTTCLKGMGDLQHRIHEEECLEVGDIYLFVIVYVCVDLVCGSIIRFYKEISENHCQLTSVDEIVALLYLMIIFHRRICNFCITSTGVLED